MLEFSKVHDISILHLYGEISQMEMEMVEKALKSLKSSAHHKVLIDLAQVDYLHLKAVKLWAKKAKEFKAKDGDIKLVQANEDIRHMLKFTGADRDLQDYASASEAILSFLNISQNFCAQEELEQDDEMFARKRRARTPDTLLN